MNSYSAVLVTCPDLKEARKIARLLLTSKLAACVNIVPHAESHYWWQGKIESAKEVLLIIKTKRTLMNRLIEKVKSAHSYTVPEVIALRIDQGSRAYLKWMDQSLSH